MIPLTAQSLVIAGALILGGALFPIRRLMAQLPPGPVYNRWYAMTALITVFLLGYLGYLGVFWNRHASLPDLIVPVVFFFGACFVWLTANLSLQTTMDVMRISVLEREVLIDPLTGVLNRRSLDGRMNEEVARARRYGKPLSVLLIDIDHFKHINDSYGHQTGDKVLCTMVKIVAEMLRETDVLTRYGGEEFLVVTPHTPLLGAANLAERVRNRIASHDFGLPDEPGGVHGTGVTISIGVASLGDGVDDAERLVLAADKNLYRAKQEGRNRVVSDAPSAIVSQGHQNH